MMLSMLLSPSTQLNTSMAGSTVGVHELKTEGHFNDAVQFWLSPSVDVNKSIATNHKRTYRDEGFIKWGNFFMLRFLVSPFLGKLI